MHNPLLIKTFTAAGAIAARRIVCLESDKDVSQATDESAVNLGVTELACNAGDSVDVVLVGVVDVKAGGTIARGDWVTSDAEGRAVAVESPADAALGVAVDSAASGEMVSVCVVPQRSIDIEIPDSSETVATFKTIKVIAAGTIVAQSGAKVVAAAKGTANVIGVAKTATETIVNRTQGDPIDVVVAGVAEVTAAGTIRVGDHVTASSDPNAVGQAAQAGEYDNVLGIALEDASAGDTLTVAIERDRRRVDQVIPVPEYTATSFPFGESAESNPITIGLIGYLDSAGGVVASMVDITQPPIGVCIDSDGSDIAMATSGICNVFCRPSDSSSSVNQISVGDYVGAASDSQSFGAVAVSAAGRWYVGKAVTASDSETGLVKVLINPGQIPASS